MMRDFNDLQFFVAIVTHRGFSAAARALGLPCTGLVAGATADLVVLDSDLAVTGVLHQGSWVIDP